MNGSRQSRGLMQGVNTMCRRESRHFSTKSSYHRYHQNQHARQYTLKVPTTITNHNNFLPCCNLDDVCLQLRLAHACYVSVRTYALQWWHWSLRSTSPHHHHHHTTNITTSHEQEEHGHDRGDVVQVAGQTRQRRQHPHQVDGLVGLLVRLRGEWPQERDRVVVSDSGH